jgi:glycosyltransferase involved in cell wall biosynthesis
VSVRALQVSWHLDPQRRAPAALLDAWPTLVDAAAAAARAGVDVAVVQAADADATIERDGVRFEFVGVRRGTGARARMGPWAAPVDARMLERIAALRPDVLHQHGLTHPLHARALSRRLRGMPLLVQDHASRPSRRMRSVHRWGFGAASAVAFTAREQAAPFVAAGALRPSVRIVELLESSSRFTPGERAAARRSTGIHGAPCVLWLGHLNANKDPLTVLRGVELAAASLPDIRLWLAWRHAPLLDEVRAYIAASPVLHDRVTLLGARPHAEVEQLLRAADFLVQGSRFEGSGYAVIEAFACVTTPIVTDIVPFRRITANGSAGALFPVGDAAALARALVAWAERDAHSLRCAARAHFERALSFDVVGAELQAAYATLAAAP